MNISYGLKLVEKDILSRCFHTIWRLIFIVSLFSSLLYTPNIPFNCITIFSLFASVNTGVCIHVCMYVCMCMEAQICRASAWVHFNFYQVLFPESWTHKFQSDNLDLMSLPPKFSKITANSCLVPAFCVVSGDLNSQSSYLYNKRGTHWASSLRPVYFLLMGSVSFFIWTMIIVQTWG